MIALSAVRTVPRHEVWTVAAGSFWEAGPSEERIRSRFSRARRLYQGYDVSLTCCGAVICPGGGSKLWALGVAELEIASNALDDIAYLRRARCRGWRVQRMDNELDAEAVVVWLREAPQPRHRQERN